MKKIIALLTCVFVASFFEGCAPYNNKSWSNYGYYQPEPEPEPPPQPKPKPKPKPKPVKKVTEVKRTIPETKVVTGNLYPIPKALSVDNDLTIASLTPVTYTYPYRCNEVYFFTAIVTPASGYHGIVDISMSETVTNGMYTCKYFGSAVVYKIKPNPFIKETVKYEDVVRKFTPE